LSTHLKDKLDRIERILAQLTEESAKGNLIVVEGRKDAEALIKIGVIGPILTVKTGGKSFADVSQEIERFSVKEVILLLDFDRRGMEGTQRLQQDLERMRIKSDLTFWFKLHRLVGREINCIESLHSYIETAEKKLGEYIQKKSEECLRF
jgi:5S rRNA maturation endonuclease (ribonuclease M5)